MRCTESPFPASYFAVHRHDGAVIQRGRRERLEPCVVQPRDVSIVADVRRYKFLTAPQLGELWWPNSSVQAADRRLLKLFRAGYLDRFRPISRRGSFPWTYPAGDLLLSWEGETHIEPPREAKASQGVLRVGDYWSAERLRDPCPRLVRPDVFFIEYDRTRRVDKNYEKFRRYDTFRCWWWQHTSFSDGDRPYVMFICQDEDQRNRFLNAADRELTGQVWHPSAGPEAMEYVGRQRVLFACELDVHLGRLEARRVPNVPPGKRDGSAALRGVRLPAIRATERAA